MWNERKKDKLEEKKEETKWGENKGGGGWLIEGKHEEIKCVENERIKKKEN